MATEHRGPRRRRVDPVVAGVGEGVAAGYRAVEIVTAAMAESVRRRPGPPFADERDARRGRSHASGRARSHGTGSGARHGSVIGDIADLTAELLEALGEAAQEIAGHIDERFDEEPDCPRIELHGVAGDDDGAEGEFEIRNTGESALRGVRFVATDLIGARGQLSDAVKLRCGDSDEVPRIPVGGSAIVTVTVYISEDAPPGAYRGLIAAQAEPRRGTDERGLEEAWTLLELYVHRPRRRRRVEHDRDAEDE